MHGMKNARPQLGGTGRAAERAASVSSAHPYSIPFRPVLLEAAKRGRVVVLAKLVIPRPLNRIAVAVPYRHRQEVEHPSLTPATLELARRMGAEWWIIRLDLKGECYGLPLPAVEHSGWLKPSEGRPEWFVPLTRFQPLPWQEWEYVQDRMRVDAFPDNPEPEPEREPEGRQLALFGRAT